MAPATKLAANGSAVHSSDGRNGAQNSSQQHDGYFSPQSYLQNPYFLMVASLTPPDRDEELHHLKDGKTVATTGSTVSSLYPMKLADGQDGAIFVFPDLSVRTEGSNRLKFTLYEMVGGRSWLFYSLSSPPPPSPTTTTTRDAAFTRWRQYTDTILANAPAEDAPLSTETLRAANARACAGRRT